MRQGVGGAMDSARSSAVAGSRRFSHVGCPVDEPATSARAAAHRPGRTAARADDRLADVRDREGHEQRRGRNGGRQPLGERVP
jgi:hypothetical protein